jgi:hypothetical protein
MTERNPPKSIETVPNPMEECQKPIGKGDFMGFFVGISCKHDGT